MKSLRITVMTRERISSKIRKKLMLKKLKFWILMIMRKGKSGIKSHSSEDKNRLLVMMKMSNQENPKSKLKVTKRK